MMPVKLTEHRLEGPLLLCEHTHRCQPHGRDGSEPVARVEYRLPAGPVSDADAAGVVARQPDRRFRFRHACVRHDPERNVVRADQSRLKVAIAGAGGLIGSHLAAHLTTAGHDVVRLVRRPAREAGEITWDPDTGQVDSRSLDGVEAVVNLAGVGLSSIWTKGRKEAILGSRVRSTRTLVAAMERMEKPPAVFVSASAIGAYGSRGGEILTEKSDRGAGFLAQVCREWEAAAAPARAAGVRVVTPRFGIVLTASGGALAAMLPAFRVGLGGRIGEGRQWWSWVALHDALGALEWLIRDPGLGAVVNLVSPEPVTNRDFARILGRVLNRPACLKVPRGVVASLGEMPREILLASQRAVPARLAGRGFCFAFPSLEVALRHELDR